RFEINANIPAGTTEAQLRAMERNLLADRFHLAAHFAKKEMQIYEMTVAPGGPKFKEWSDASQPSLDRAGGPKSAPDLRLTPTQDSIEFRYLDCRHMFKARASMDQLAQLFSGRLRKPVVDATGLAGVYDIMFNFSMDPPETSAVPTFPLP